MSEHEWQWGDWGRTQLGTICRFVSRWGDQSIFVMSNGAINSLVNVTYLPDCTGFDWKPIEPPEGYRLLRDDERIEPLDEYFHRGSWFITSEECRPFVAERKNESVHAYARKIEPQYRPFANAAEYAPHFDRTVRFKDNSSCRLRSLTYDDKYVWFCGLLAQCYGMPYGEAFQLREFENGEPFGVEQ